MFDSPILLLRHALGFALVAGACLLPTLPKAQENDYPSKTITIVVPYPPGGSNDTFARQIAIELGEQLKQSVIIDNRPGASGNIGTAQVARAVPDGYTLVAVSSSITTNSAIRSDLSFDAVKSFTPVAMLAKGPLIVAVNNEFAATTPTEFIAAIRAKPGAYNYASSGAGSINHFGTELLRAHANNLEITHVPYKGMGPAVLDLVSNQTQMLLSSGPSLLPMVRAGKLRAIGITSQAPSPIAPELIPMSTAVPGYDFELWWGVLAPAGTPADVVTKLNAAINRALSSMAVADRFLREGAIATPMTPAQFSKIIVEDIARWKQLAKQQNIRVE